MSGARVQTLVLEEPGSPGTESWQEWRKGHGQGARPDVGLTGLGAQWGHGPASSQILTLGLSPACPLPQISAL